MRIMGVKVTYRIDHGFTNVIEYSDFDIKDILFINDEYEHDGDKKLLLNADHVIAVSVT